MNIEDDIEDEMENADYLVCALAAGLEGDPDNILGECCVCGNPIIYSTNMPKRPKKVCMRCAVDMMEANN
jgi:hypothetical protein